jgi:ABC-type transport system substrate-binding protein
MRDIGVRITFQHQKWPDLVKMARAGQLPMWQVGWVATSADSYMELAYGPNGGQSNLSFFKNAEYDELMKQSRSVRTEAERDKLYARMTAIIAAYAPMGGGIYRIENTIAKPWIVGYKKDSFRSQPWRFVDVDTARMRAAQ